MARQPLDEQIDQLYQLPLDEFTSARNALAKEAGPEAAAIKRLEKPNAAAWAINQLFWRERKLYDQVMDASTRRRDVYRQMLAGKNVDAAKADADHRGAIRAAAQAGRAILEKTGSKPTDAVMAAISETLDALPGAEAPGRLTKSLKRIGFEGLEGVPVAAGPRKVTPIIPRAARTEPANQPTNKERQAAEAKARELAMVRERTERTRERIEQELGEATEAAKKARKEQSSAQTAYERAVAERKQLAKKLS
jgi:hypothetical protein